MAESWSASRQVPSRYPHLDPYPTTSQRPVLPTQPHSYPSTTIRATDAPAPGYRRANSALEPPQNIPFTTHLFIPPDDDSSDSGSDTSSDSPLLSPLLIDEDRLSSPKLEVVHADIPFKSVNRRRRRPSPQYLATPLSANPLGLTNTVLVTEEEYYTYGLPHISIDDRNSRGTPYIRQRTRSLNVEGAKPSGTPRKRVHWRHEGNQEQRSRPPTTLRNWETYDSSEAENDRDAASDIGPTTVSFTSKLHLRPTFTPNIIRTPDHYRSISQGAESTDSLLSDISQDFLRPGIIHDRSRSRDTSPAPDSLPLNIFQDIKHVKDLTTHIKRDVLFAVGGGGYADVFQCTLNSGNGAPIKVAVKALRSHTYTENNKWKIDKRLKREIRVWSSLNHPNIVPLLGITLDFGPYPSMVCPWMEDGELFIYLKHKTLSDVSLRDRLSLLAQVIEGLCYLHTNQIIHGDLTPSNILLNNGRAHLSDFGLSNVMADIRGSSFLTSKVGGAVRWAAPELLSSTSDDNSAEVNDNLTPKCDIYSFGCVALYVLSGQIPYAHLQSDYQIVLQLTKNYGHPPRPADSFLTDAGWEFVQMCWGASQEQRPDAMHTRTLLNNILSPPTPSAAPPAALPYPTYQPPLPASPSPDSPLPLVLSTRRPNVRKGYWNRRGDHLTADGYIVYAPATRAYPEELGMYPPSREGYQNERGDWCRWVARPELPESMPRDGKEAARPYESFIVYVNAPS